jgi:hypothetical protein
MILSWVVLQGNPRKLAGMIRGLIFGLYIAHCVCHPKYPGTSWFRHVDDPFMSELLLHLLVGPLSFVIIHTCLELASRSIS